MWLVRLSSGVARPCARGRKRFMVGPAPTTALRTTRSVTRTLPSRLTALATADLSSFSAIFAPFLGVKCRMFVADSTSLPRISPRIWFALRGVMRTNRTFAVASIDRSVLLLRRRCRGGHGGLFDVRAVATEHARGNELAELVADHVLGHVDRDELVAVVHGERVPDELGQDRAAARPRLEDALLARTIHALDLLHQAVDDVRTLLDRTCHLLLPPPFDPLLARLVAARLVALRRLAPGGARVTAARRLALAAAHRVVDGVLGHAAHVRANAQPAAAPGLADHDVLVLDVAHLPDHAMAVEVETAHLARRQADLGVVTLFRHELAHRPGGARDAGAAVREQLERVDRRAERHRAQRHRIARHDVGIAARDERVAHLEAERRDD